MARKATPSQLTEMEWQARKWGYDAAKDHPTIADVNAVIATVAPNVRFTDEQRNEFVQLADYAYMLRCRHNATGIPSSPLGMAV